MSKKIETTKSVLDIQVSTSDCPFREFRDNELSTDYWGLGSIAFKTALRMGKGGPKTQSDHVWVDDQIQPLPRSARKRLHGWMRAEDLAQNQWKADVTVFEDNNGGKMSTADIQFAHYQVLQMSAFCRRVLSMCYMLERAEGFTVEHQWDNFVFYVPPEGWRARYHIYSPGMKHGGGQQHRPALSKNGCYLVRLYYIGAWRCVWVSDQVPVDSSGAPLLPLAPFFNQASTKPAGRQYITNTTVHLWPLLLCKALLKLAAPDMNTDDGSDYMEDEPMKDMDILHALTGSLNLTYYIEDADELWKLITTEVQLFTWDEDDETYSSNVKSKTKKPGTKENSVIKRRSLTTVLIEETRNVPPFTLPGITPAFEMHLLVVMARDLPLKKPLPEPEVAPWKHHRWIDWARKHGLYEEYDCPRTRFLKMSGLLKLSLAPHLLDVQSTESITFGFREEHARTTPGIKKTGKDKYPSVTTSETVAQLREELREWVQFDAIQKLMKSISTLCFPSMYQFCSIASNPPMRITKLPPNKEIDIPAPKNAPLYLQIDAPEEMYLKISCSMLHPRVFLNANQPIEEYVEPGYVLLETFQWFTDCEIPKSKAYLQTRGYDSTEVSFKPGRHFCRLWIHSRVPWYVMLLSESTIHVGTRDVIQMASIRVCPWASRFLTTLGTAFQNFMRTNKSNSCLTSADREFYRSYQPDLDWNPKEVGFSKSHIHWMFRQALQSTLEKKLPPFEYRSICTIFQHYFNDPDFGLSKKELSSVSSKNLIINDLCDCTLSEAEEIEISKIQYNDADIDDKTVDDQPTICNAASEKLPCGILKSIRDKTIKRHEAATCIQAHWRGIRARRCLDTRVTVTPEIMKYLTENVFGNQETLTTLMNEFFYMFPGAKSAYSVSSALTGTSGLKQYNGVSPVTPQCTWVPYFQAVFYCHAPVKIHFDLQSSIGMNKVNCTFEVYNNDTKKQLPQVYTAHLTFDFSPNIDGYTVIGHGILKQPTIASSEIRWQLTMMSSVENVFHVCDNEMDGCKELPILSVTKLHLEEIFIPNQRNILGGIQIYVLKHEIISFRAAATSPDLEMEAVLRTTEKSGEVTELATCSGTGEIYWPFIRLEPAEMTLQSISHANVNTVIYFIHITIFLKPKIKVKSVLHYYSTCW
ncbi:unnamed protein product [Parnassius mnemosyne]|uniref:Androglobin n=1 Tax=Parnassius mnemosyne TaxID=213953 RepID=A0AAV1LL88_9NEOP